MKAHNCPFCFTEQSPLTIPIEEDWHGIKSRLLTSHDEVSLCAGLGAIVEPYAIAFTRDHKTAVSELDLAATSSLFDVLDRCLESRLFPSQTLTVFEHGGRSPDNATACLEHCHLHIIDGQFDLRLGLLGDYANAEHVCVSEATGFVADSGYLFTGVYAGDRSITGLLVRTPSCGSQYFRRHLAAQSGSLLWDWRVSPMPATAFRLQQSWRRAGLPEGSDTLAMNQRRGAPLGRANALAVSWRS